MFMMTIMYTFKMTEINHRTRVAAERRHKMRERLITGALSVFAEKGLHETAIDDVIKAVDVSRGTFYKYFRTHEDLLEAVSASMSDYLMRLVDPLVLTHADPAERVASGIRLWIQAGQTVPHLAKFISKAPWPDASSGGLALVYLSRDIQAGMHSGRFDVPHLQVGLDMVIGPVMSALHAMTLQALPANHASDLAGTVLRGLGIKTAEAKRLATLPLMPLAVPWQTTGADAISSAA